MIIKVSTLNELYQGMRALAPLFAEPSATPEEEQKPFLFPDEICEILSDVDKDVDIMIGPCRWHNDYFLHDPLVNNICDALKKGRTVTIDGKNILDM